MAKKTTSTTPNITMQLLTVRDVASKGYDAFQVIGREQVLVNEAGAITPTGPLGFNLDAHVGEIYRNKPVIDLAGVVAHIDSGTAVKLPTNIITYTFLEKSHLIGLYNNPQVGFTAGDHVSPFSAAQRGEARQSIQFWDDLIAPTFVEQKGLGADIQFANSYDPAQAYAFYPDSHGYKFQSDVFIADPRANSTNNWLGFGGYGATTLIHEIGHTIGLSHPGAYNYDPNLVLTYANYAEYAQDSTQYTIMSYWDEQETGGRTRDWLTLQNNNPQSPLLHDILTVQAKYGADLTTRADDTVYGFNSNANRDIFDFSANKFPFLAIYDAGGKDTIDLSGFNASNFLDLHAGSFSSVGQAIPTLAEITAARIELSAILGFTLATRSQAFVDNLASKAINYSKASIFADTGVAGIAATQYQNLAIAYGTHIENGIGGSARDLIWGNELANRLEGRGGNDVLDGYEGADTLIGGAGADTFKFHNIEKGDHIVDFSHNEGDKIDLTGFKNLDGSTVHFTFIGSSDFAHHAGELRYAGGQLQADFNGDGVADFAIFLDNSAPIVVSDLIFG